MNGHTAPDIDESVFQADVIEKGTTALVCFVAEWSKPCKEIWDVIDRLADAFYGRVTVYRADPEALSLSAAKYGVASIPTLMLFAGGEAVSRMVGARSYEDIEKMLNKHLSA